MNYFRWLDNPSFKNTIRKIWAPIRKIMGYRWFNPLMKGLIIGAIFYTIYSQVFSKDNIHELWDEFLLNFTWKNAWWVIMAFILMPVNWAFETLKWQTLVNRVEKVPFLRAYKGIFLGVALSIFTPNRIGEYGGRVLVVKPENNLKTVVATLVGSFSQMVALLSVGIIGTIYFMVFHLDIEGYLIAGISLIGLTLIVFMLIGYYNVGLAVALFRRIPYLRRFTKDMKMLRHYSSKELTIALVYALARYYTYSLQYYLILRFFGIDAPFISGMSGIATIYLLQTSIPLPAIADLFVRSEVALFIWGFFTDNEISILASTFGLWILNIIVPALVGMMFVFSVNIGGQFFNKKKEQPTTRENQ